MSASVWSTVVQVRGDVGPLGLARPGGPLVAELAHQPQPPRGEDDRDAREHRDRGHGGPDDLGGPRVLADEQHDADEHEHDAARDAQDPGGRAPARPGEQPAPLDGVELAPRERRARERDEDRMTQETSTSTPVRSATSSAAPPSRTTPIATSRTGRRRTLPWRRGASRDSEAGRCSSRAASGSPGGTVSHQNTYSATPAPPASARSAMTRRTTPTPTPRCAARPAHTPPTHRPRSGRRSGRSRGRAPGRAAVVTPIVTRRGRPERPRAGKPGSRAGRFRVGSGWHPIPAVRPAHQHGGHEHSRPPRTRRPARELRRRHRDTRRAAGNGPRDRAAPTTAPDRAGPAPPARPRAHPRAPRPARHPGGRAAPTASSTRSAASASTGRTTAGSAASRPVSRSASGSTRSSCAACCS